MREYEFTFVVQPEISDEGIQAISERFEGILSAGGSEKLFYEDWGRRRLAYEVRNFQKGHYQVLHFLSDGAVIPELERSARIDDSVLRFLTVLVSPVVSDVEARRAEATTLESERIKRAAERAQREAEEAQQRAADESARAAEEAKRAAEEAKRAEAESEAAESAEAETGESESPEAESKSAGDDPAPEPAAAAEPPAADEAASEQEPT